MTLHPNEGIIIVEPYEDKTSSMLATPDTQKNRDLVGKVVAVGAPVMDARIKDVVHPAPLSIKVGDLIVHRTYYGEAYKDFSDGKIYKFIRFEDVVAIRK